MTDIVYVVGKGAKKQNDLPLRWSLRSVEKFATNVGRIIVAGYPPDWLSDKVIKVYFEQTHKKHVNMLLSIAAAVNQVGLTEKFLYSSDDHYFCQPANLDKWPRYCLGTLPSVKQWKEKFKGKNKKLSRWHITLSQTRFLLREIGLGIVRANLHADTWVDPIDINEAVEFSLKHEKKCELGVEPQCVLSALYDKRMKLLGKQPPVYIQYRADRKVKTAEECAKVIKDKLPMFSTDATAEEKNKELVAWMNGFFAFPSKYENDNI